MRVIVLLASLAGFGCATLQAARPELEIRILYDNTAAGPDFEADWGFSALVTFRGRRVLFDAGTHPDILLHNMRLAGVDPHSIPVALISHHHVDHRGGIYRLGERNHSMKVYFLDSFPREAFELAYAVGLNPRRVGGPEEIAPGIYTTGPVSGHPPEQALVVETAKGLVVLVGCSHPGVVRMVETAERQRGKQQVRLLLGGFHMLQESEEQIQAQIGELKQLHVIRVAPAHCTGERAKRLFRRAWGADYVAAGAGRRIVVQ